MSIIQFPLGEKTGMGKSRVIDELAKTHLVVPINLREGLTGMLFRLSLVLFVNLLT